jgi:3-hydroxyisobutyrate dehydrogenase-like beta-hydroxyacid dehydrogenase
MANVAFIGLGVMGYPMAGHLKVKGRHEVTVYNRTFARAEKWVEQFGGKAARTPAEAARDADFVFVCVGNDDDLRSVTTAADGAIEGMKPGAILIDNTTASAEVARELDAAARQKGCGFIDAYARMVGLMGPSGAGQLTKMINQICIAGLVQGLAEGIHFGKRAGLDIETVIEVISKGAAGSWQMENRHKTMNEGKYDFGFAVDWMRKDLDIVLSEAKRNGARLPVTAIVDQFYGDVQDMGGKRWDTSSLLARLER